MTSPKSPDQIAAGLMSPEHIADPYAQRRELDPVLFLEPINAWLITRFDDVKTVFKDDRLGVAFGQYQVNRQARQSSRSSVASPSTTTTLCHPSIATRGYDVLPVIWDV